MKRDLHMTRGHTADPAAKKRILRRYQVKSPLFTCPHPSGQEYENLGLARIFQHDERNLVAAEILDLPLRDNGGWVQDSAVQTNA
jgi:hypothetical protein